MTLINEINIMDGIKNNRENTLKHIQMLLNHHYCMNIKNSKIIFFLNMVPLPKQLFLKHTDNTVDRVSNIYTFIGNREQFILPGDIVIPNKIFSPIPFTFPYIINNEHHLILSNVYYFEVYITSINTLESWDSMNIGIGFGYSGVDLVNSLIGWSNDTIGYNSLSGNVYTGQYNDKYLKPFGPNDTVGAGIIYNENDYTVFFTLNGVLLGTFKYNTPFKIIPLVSLCHCNSVLVNFSTMEFKYDFTKHIDNNVLSLHNEYIKNALFDRNLYKYSNVFLN